jgi:hypothetical protein
MQLFCDVTLCGWVGGSRRFQGRLDPTAFYHSQEYLYPQLYRCENLRARKWKRVGGKCNVLF